MLLCSGAGEPRGAAKEVTRIVVESPRIVVDARFLRVSGIGTYLRSVLPGVLSRLPEARWELLIRPEDRAVAGTLGAARLRDLPSPPLSLREQVTVVWHLRRRADLLWVPHVNVPVLAPVCAARLAVTLHDLYVAEPGLASPTQRLYARGVLPVIRRYADPIFCVSRATRDRWVRAYPGGAAPVVTPNGVDPSWFHPPAGPLPAPLAFLEERPFLLFAGNVKPHKNLVRLIQAFGRIRDAVDHRLVLAGNLEGLRTVDRSAEALIRDSGDRIRRVGFLETPALQQVVARADAFVFPSLYEGFGLPPLEAMAAGTPVAAARIPAVQEVCGDAAHLFDPLDVADMGRRILEVLGDPDLRRRLTARGAARAREMTWDASVAQVAASLRSRLGLPGLPGGAP